MSLDRSKLERFFPDVDPRYEPLGNLVVVQGMHIEEETAGVIILPEEVRVQEAYDVQIGKVVALGPLAFRDKETLEIWKEGLWANVGDLVYVTRSGDRIPRIINGIKYNFILLSDNDFKVKIKDLDGIPMFNKF